MYKDQLEMPTEGTFVMLWSSRSRDKTLSRTYKWEDNTLYFWNMDEIKWERMNTITLPKRPNSVFITFTPE